MMLTTDKLSKKQKGVLADVLHYLDGAKYHLTSGQADIRGAGWRLADALGLLSVLLGPELSKTTSSGIGSETGRGFKLNIDFLEEKP